MVTKEVQLSEIDGLYTRSRASDATKIENFEWFPIYDIRNHEVRAVVYYTE